MEIGFEFPADKMNEPQFDTNNLKIFNDNAIDNTTSFNFDSYVKTIKKIILYPENKTPFSISINGKWGSGKTSLMKTLRRELESNSTLQLNERNVRTVWFNAWKYSDTDNLLAALASEIYQEMVYPSLKVKKGLRNRIKGIFFGSVEMHMNGSSHPKHENKKPDVMRELPASGPLRGTVGQLPVFRH